MDIRYNRHNSAINIFSNKNRINNAITKIMNRNLLSQISNLEKRIHLENELRTSKIRPKELILDALKIDAISKPAIEMLNRVIVFMPRILIAIVIIFVGKYLFDNRRLLSCNEILLLKSPNGKRPSRFSRLFPGIIEF